MKREELQVDFDLVNTLESGQSFLWRREGDSNGDGNGNDDEANVSYTTVIDGDFVRVEETAEGVAYETTGVSEARLRETLGLDDPLDEIHAAIDDDPRVKKAIDKYGGMRVVSDDFFPCAVSFIISAQNRIPRIKSLVDEIAEEYGERVEADGYEAYAFPEPHVLAAVEEEELRDIGLGYRAPYVIETAEMVANGVVDA
ncbi:MAG: DNA glycosylase, partial [Halobacteria archaeon]|nr:DNA glycosylase [Halobacteria archaeon]